MDWWFQRFVRLLLSQTIHDVAVMIDRERAGREASSRLAWSTARWSKAPAGAKRGYDTAKRTVGCKRHVDADGRPLMVNLTTADISNSAGAQPILDAMRKRWPG